MAHLTNQQPSSDTGEEQSSENIAAIVKNLQSELKNVKEELNVVKERVRQLETFGVKYSEMGGETFFYFDLERLYDPIKESLGDNENAKRDFDEFVSERRKDRLKMAGGLTAAVGGVAFIGHLVSCGGIIGSLACLGIGAGVTAVILFGIWAYRNRERWTPKVESFVKRIKDKFRDEFPIIERLVIKQD